jgi:predicted permease
MKARRMPAITPVVQRLILLGALGMWLDRVIRDLRFGIRSLRQSPRFALIAVVTVALGVGANTAVFSVMNAVLLRSLPVRDPQRLVYLRTSRVPINAGRIEDYSAFNWPVYQALRAQHDVFTDLIAIAPPSVDKINIRIGNDPEQAKADMVSGNFFSGLHVGLALGRGFTPRDEADHTQVMVLSYNFWTRRFSRDSAVLGKTMYVKGVPFTIVGVASRGFEGTEAGSSLDFWIPLQDRIEFNVFGHPPLDGELYQHQPRWWCMRLIARLAPGVTRQQAVSRTQPVFQHAAYIGIGSPLEGEQLPLLSFEDAKNFRGYEEDYGKPLRMLMAMVALVLLIALTNVLMLIAARNAARQREFCLRLALGAGRADLFGQLLCEGVLLVAMAGVLAWGFAIVGARLLGYWALIETSLAPDRTVLLFTFGVLLISALFFALAPLRLVLGNSPVLAMKTSAATSRSDVGTTRLGKVIVTLQVALCVVLLVGAGLLVRTLQNLENVPLGIDTDGLLVFGLNPHSLHAQPDAIRFYQELQRQLRALPRVKSLAVLSTRMGTNMEGAWVVKIDGKDPAGDRTVVVGNSVGPDIFRTLGVPILQGREFTDADTAASQQVVIVNALFAEKFLPNQNPIGHRVNDATIVGVVANHKYTTVEEEPAPMVWWNYTQETVQGSIKVEMRIRGDDALSLLPAVRKVVAGMDPNLPLVNPMLQREQFEETISDHLLFARLGEFFGILAVLLVAIGLYGTLAFRVNRRTAEIGVRMAFGARRGQVLWLILRGNLLLTSIGVMIGLPLAVLVAKALSSSLYGVSPFDPLIYLLAVAGLVLVALASSALPARRAASVDPVEALRTE